MKDIQVPLFHMVMCLSNAVDLVSPTLDDHHKRTSFIATSIAEEMGLSDAEQMDVLMAGAMHDIGAISFTENLDSLWFDTDNPQLHAEMGFRHIRTFKPFASAADLVRFHHVRWEHGAGERFQGCEVPAGSHIIHLADRVDMLTNRRDPVPAQLSGICDELETLSGTVYMPEAVSAFRSLSKRKAFWLDATSRTINRVLFRRAGKESFDLDMDGILNMAMMFARIIDFRSRFTALHSGGVAACAYTLAESMGLSDEECKMIRVAGYMHDIGKLAIPREILEKPARLTEEELHVVKCHPYYTHRVLDSIDGLELINSWASFHHERLDGTGYPFCREEKNLPLGSRIVAVADVFTALTEDRPYRAGMTPEVALEHLKDMAADHAVDAEVVGMLAANFCQMDDVRKIAQYVEYLEYQEFSDTVLV
ncbi:MAG: HD domain-containing protein [Nitrospirae bacterium]|nr:HD domain-containing protein [Nitrospirota bacterium]MBI5695898.1 HD domain-containing protein [Nitrospirota bacterium]